MHFSNRVEAGRQLAKLLEKYKGTDCVVYALPRGGAVIGAEVAKALNVPLDLIITRKIGHPSQSEYAIGAVGENGCTVFNREETEKISEQYITQESQKQQKEARRRRDVYLAGRKPINCQGKTAIIVDDGIATGLTMQAAVKEIQAHYKPSKIIIAVPVIPIEVADEFETRGVEVIALLKTGEFAGSIGAYFKDFSQVDDEEVIKIMKQAD